ncbi:DUF4382 domain-containing protein [Geothrix sp. 21YS21S-4]|uniref:DUF4382 domain-containing protein n=1 Tax=Geothrix sp. 21YS21S-4 TaxID=3068889 RepID=UPI0027BAAA55|nr:DUF4382 domain-containing protein [Geothrix sp. 21YS21S-4]
MRIRSLLASLLSLGLTLACGGGGGAPNRSSAVGTLTVRLGSDSFPGYTSAVVSVEKVEGTVDGATWISLGNVKTTYDLLALQGGNSVALLSSVQVTAATYSQFRVTWATVNYQSGSRQPGYVILNGGNDQLLSLPTTTVIKGNVAVPSGGSATALLMLSGDQAVQLHAGSGYQFQATGRAQDLAATARITGKIAAGATNLAGVEVLSETVDGTGLASIQRRALTDASGNYILEGLPVGSVYFVVAQPAASALYAAAAAAPVNATLAATYTADLGFSTLQTGGGLTLTITPGSTSSQGTWGELRQTLATGSTGFQTLIVRSQTVATGVAQDQAGFEKLAPGLYGVTVQRSTSGGTPVAKKMDTQASVSAGGTAIATVSY